MINTTEELKHEEKRLKYLKRLAALETGVETDSLEKTDTLSLVQGEEKQIKLGKQLQLKLEKTNCLFINPIIDELETQLSTAIKTLYTKHTTLGDYDLTFSLSITDNGSKIKVGRLFAKKHGKLQAILLRDKKSQVFY